MRGPVTAGVLAGLLVVLVAVSGFVMMALGRPDPIIATPTVPPVAVPTSAPPLGSPSPSLPSSSPVETPPPSPTAEPGTSPTPSAPVGLGVGDRAPQLVLPGLASAEIDTRQLEGQAIWVNFMATWCPPCIDELPMMQRFQAQLEDELTIIVVDVREPEEVVGDFMASLSIELPVGLDLDGAAQREWGAYVLPVHYWIGPDGRIGDFVYGGAGPEQFVEGIRSVLPDAEVDF